MAVAWGCVWAARRGACCSERSGLAASLGIHGRANNAQFREWIHFWNTHEHAGFLGLGRSAPTAGLDRSRGAHAGAFAMNAYPHIGERLRDRRQSAQLTAKQVCEATGISRTLLYRYESGEVVKLDVLEKLARIYDTSTSALLGIGNEYIAHGMVFFDRLQRLEEHADRITTVFGPQAYMLSSADYDRSLAQCLVDQRPDQLALTPAEAERLMYVLKKRKQLITRGQTTLINIIPVSDIRLYLEHGLGGHAHLPAADIEARKAAARKEMQRLAALIAAPPMGVQFALTTQPVPTAGFELLQIAGRRVLVTSPFRIVEPINLHFGVAMISEDELALRVHEALAARLWESALKGADASAEMRRLLQGA
jgi:transcriptional regulator with XRE-family HTH domain